MFAPVTEALIEEAGISEGDEVLDVAGGPGEPSVTIAEVVGPNGSVMCTDAVAEMVEAARHGALRRGLNNISFRQCQADSLPFDENSFDKAVSRLGVMFFPDTLSALREMLRVIKLEGSLSFAVWHESNVNPFAYMVTDVLSRYIDVPTPDPEMKPNSFLISAFLLLALVNFSCAQPKQKAEPLSMPPPPLIWQHDTGG